MSMWGTTYMGKFSKSAFIFSKRPTREKYIIFRSFKKFLQVNLQAPKARRDLISHQIQSSIAGTEHLATSKLQFAKVTAQLVWESQKVSPATLILNAGN